MSMVPKGSFEFEGLSQFFQPPLKCLTFCPWFFRIPQLPSKLLPRLPQGEASCMQEGSASN